MDYFHDQLQVILGLRRVMQYVKVLPFAEMVGKSRKRRICTELTTAYTPCWVAVSLSFVDRIRMLNP